MFDSSVPQVRIHNTSGNSKKVLSMKRSDLLTYVERIRKEPTDWYKWDYNPLLAVKDSYNTQEEWEYRVESDFPTENVVNSKGDVVLEILPE